MIIWIKDPKDGLPSVSLTLLIVSFLLAILGNVLQILGYVSNTSSTMEMLYSFVALYFSRRFKFGGKDFSSEPAEKIEQKIEETIKE